MLSYCRRFAVLAFVAVVASSSLRAQEAVETPTPSEESTPKAKASKEETPKPAKSLEETMRPEEFKAAGLDRLSEDELQHLDAYLQGYRESAKKKAAEQANAKAQDEIKKANEKADQAQKATEDAKRDAAVSARTKLDTLVSRVDGNINGVTGRTIIKLEDGSVWKQVNAVDRGDNRYRATVTDHPTAVVLHTTFGYKMRIEGMPEFYVDPVSKP
jgi:hypothetical protein